MFTALVQIALAGLLFVNDPAILDPDPNVPVACNRAERRKQAKQSRS